MSAAIPVPPLEAVREATGADRGAIGALVEATEVHPYRTYGIYAAEFPALALAHTAAGAVAALDDPDAVVLVLDDPRGGLAGVLVAHRNAFDTHHLGVPVRRIRVLEGPPGDRARHDVATALLTVALRDHQALYLLDVDAADVHVLAAAQGCGFEVFDTSMTYVAPVPTVAEHPRDARFRLTPHDRRDPPDLSEGEIDRMARDSAVSFEGSHFFADPRLDRARCAGLYDRWARNLLSGTWADWLVIASDDEGPQGALGLRSVPFAGPDGPVHLLGDAFGFSTFPRGRGVGSAMMRFYVRHAPGEFVESTTQVRTTPLLVSFAQTMRFARANYVLHGWSAGLTGS